MTDNELRAHDLTMLYVRETTRLRIAETKPSDEGKVEVPIDFFSDYIKLYPMILEKVNEEFS